MRQIVLLGAPTTTSLDWDESTLVHLECSKPDDSRSPSLESPQANGVCWRQLSLNEPDWNIGLFDESPQTAVLNTNFHIEAVEGQTHSDITTSAILTELYCPQSHPTNISSNTSSDGETETILSQFCDESFLDQDGTEGTKSFYLQSRPVRVPLSDLASISRVSDPQCMDFHTITVNVIVGIIAVPAPITVIAGRRWSRGHEIDLVELLVGDDTRSAFGISIWLQPRKENGCPEGEAETLRITLESLLPTDVILIRNMGLRSFRGKIHGQNLRRGMTKIESLYRGRLGITKNPSLRRIIVDEEGADNIGEVDRHLIEKGRRVHEWMLQFVGDRAALNWSRNGQNPHQDTIGKGFRSLPPDTQ